MVRAIFFDIDGTLIRFGTHEMPESTLRALHTLREKGIRLFLSTGRHRNKIGFINELFPFDAYITLNGQYCYNDTGLIHRCVMDKEDVAAVVEQSQRQLYRSFFLEEEGMFSCEPDGQPERNTDGFDLPPMTVRDAGYALQTDIYQINAFIREEEEHIIFDRTRTIKGARWHPEFLDIIPKDGGKEAGIRAFMKFYGFEREETMAFGDGGNDIEMLSFAGIGVAMGNAGDAVKAAADYVTSAVDEDGIHHALTHFGIL